MSLPLIGLLFVLLLFCYYVCLDRVVGVLAIVTTNVLLKFENFILNHFISILIEWTHSTTYLIDQLSLYSNCTHWFFSIIKIDNQKRKCHRKNTHLAEIFCNSCCQETVI